MTIKDCPSMTGKDHRPFYITDRVRKRQTPGSSRKFPEPSKRFQENPPPAMLLILFLLYKKNTWSKYPSLLKNLDRLDQRWGGEKKPKPRNGKPLPRIRTAVTATAIADQAAAIFDACRYSGDDGGNLWGVAALLETDIGELSESEVYSACRGAELNGRDKPKHFFACLAESVAKLRLRSDATVAEGKHLAGVAQHEGRPPNRTNESEGVTNVRLLRSNRRLCRSGCGEAGEGG